MNSVRRSRFLAGVGLTVLLCGSWRAQAAVAPSLGLAQSFGVLGAQAVTNTGPTVVTGDLGISPNTASSITGFPPGTFTGTLHAADGVAGGAQADALAAYVSLAGAACNLNLTGTDLGGLTLTPGVYCFSSSAQLTGTLTLDAGGNPGAVFVFQIGSTLTTASASAVRMINGGSNCNVFWQVGTSATLGTTTAFVGDILASASITLNTNATLGGRAIALNAAVTMASNTVTPCAPLACPTILVTPSAGTPTVLPPGVVGTPYTPQTITASGGAAPYTFAVSIGSLPGGMGLSGATANTVNISGTPTTPGLFVFTITATDSNGCTGSQQYSIQVPSGPECPTIALNPTALAAAAVGSVYNQTVTASGGLPPYTFSLSGVLPTGLAMNQTGPTTVAIQGVPTATGSFSFTITATDANGCRTSRPYIVLLLAPSGSAIPTLSGWGMIALGSLMALIGIGAIRKMGA
jgi:hypothetical protein